MLSQSRITQVTKQFLDTLNQISNQILSYYFQSQPPKVPYKMKRHLTQLYTFVYENCTAKPSYQQKMYQTYKSALLKHLIKYMDILNNSVKDNCVILTFNRIWDSFYQLLKFLAKRVFVYLNRYYVPANDLQDLIITGKNVFMRTFLADANIHVFIRPYLRQLQKMRNSKMINHGQLLQFAQILSFIDNRTHLFTILQKIYMVQAEKYYKHVFQQHCNDDPMVYLNYVNNLRYFQLMLSSNTICFNQVQENSLTQLFNRELVKKYTHIFVTQPYGFNYLLRRNKVDSLKLVAQVYEKYEGFAQLKKSLFQFIIQQGNVILTEKSKSLTHQQFINTFYQFYKNYHTIISSSFIKDSDMLNSFNGAIQKLLIKFQRLTQDLFKFARNYLDSNRFQQIQQKIIALFQKLPYKDQFINMYRTSLEKKIISGNLIYLIQKQFIQKLNKICDNQLTSNLNEILQDSIESMPKNLPIISQNFNAKIVSLHFWEKKFEDQLSLNLTLVEPLASTWRKFQNSYAQIFPKRRLILLPYETKMILKVYSSHKQMTFKCNILQACIISYIANKSTKIDQANIINDLTIQKTFLHRFLEQFPNLIVDDGQGFLSFNWKFETIDSIVDLDSRVQEEKKVTKHIKQDRDILIQCAIVKTAKRRKELTFEQLVLEVTHLVKLFKPHPSNIKSVIQTLKKKDMVEQNAEGKILYKE